MPRFTDAKAEEAFVRRLQLISSANVLIYAPPGYGKTQYVNQRSSKDYFKVIDTDDLPDDVPPNNYPVLITNYWQLINTVKANYILAFLPGREHFENLCRFRGLAYEDSWYDDVLNALKQAKQKSRAYHLVVITDESSILDHDDLVMGMYWD